ncbi:hypothetical protein D1872_316390 [compost metagenome]
MDHDLAASHQVNQLDSAVPLDGQHIGLAGDIAHQACGLAADLGGPAGGLRTDNRVEQGRVSQGHSQ